MRIDERGSEVLDRNECLRLLAVAAGEDGIARLGVATRGAPIIVPVNFTYDNRGVVIRIAKGGTIGALVGGSLVAIEVDRVNERTGEAWSVLLRGFARVLGTEGTQVPRRHAPKPLVPVPGDLVIYVRGDNVTGRRFPLLEGRKRGVVPIGERSMEFN